MVKAITELDAKHSHIKVRPETKAKARHMADTYRLKLVEAVDVAFDAFDKLSDRQRQQVLRRNVG